MLIELNSQLTVSLSRKSRFFFTPLTYLLRN